MSILQILLFGIVFFTTLYACMFIGKEIIVFFSYPKQERQYTLEDLKQAETSYTESARVRKYFFGKIYFPIVSIMASILIFNDVSEKKNIIALIIASLLIWSIRTYKGIYLEHLFVAKNHEDL